MKFWHFRTLTIPFSSITRITETKFEIQLLCGDRTLTFPRHDNQNKLWTDVLDELHRRRSLALTAMGGSAEDPYASDEEDT